MFASVGGRCGPFWSISERKERTWQRCAFRTNLIQPCLIDPPTAPYQVLLCLLYASRCGRGWRLQWSRPCSQHRHCSGTPERPKAHPPTITPGRVSSSRAHHCDILSNRCRLPKRHPGSCIDLFGFDVMFDTALKPYARHNISIYSLIWPDWTGLHLNSLVVGRADMCLRSISLPL